MCGKQRGAQCSVSAGTAQKTLEQEQLQTPTLTPDRAALSPEPWSGPRGFGRSSCPRPHCRSLGQKLPTAQSQQDTQGAAQGTALAGLRQGFGTSGRVETVPAWKGKDGVGRRPALQSWAEVPLTASTHKRLGTCRVVASLGCVCGHKWIRCRKSSPSHPDTFRSVGLTVIFS